MEQEAIYFGENRIINSAFHKNKRPININEVDIERMKLWDIKIIKNHTVKIHLSTFLDIDVKEMLFHLHYALNFLIEMHIQNDTHINLLVIDNKILEKYSEVWSKIKN